MAFFACKKDVELLHETIPEVVTGDCSDITDSSAVLSFNLKTKGSKSVMYGFYYCEAPNNTPTAMDKIITLSIQDSQSFSYTLTGLKENTTYYVRAYARNRLGEAQGEIVQFTTLSKKLPTMGISSVTNVTANSATVIGNVISAGTGTIKERGFCLSTTKTPSIADSCIAVGSEIGSFNYTLTGLEDGVTFYVCAYATSEVGTAYGEVMSFTTASEQLPVVITKLVTEITPWYATLNGELESEGTSSVTERGFCYSVTSQTPTLLDVYVIVDGSSFASVITMLAEGTTYYVRAYATNGKGTAYGETVSFTTKSLPELGSITTNNITTGSVSLSSSVTSAGSSTVTEKGFYYGTHPDLLINKIEVGQGTGLFLYDMSGLSEGTTYYVCAYATNCYGTGYGPTVSFTTKFITLPSVETVSVEDVSYTTATISGNITADGGMDVTERGICWNTTQNPTISKYKKVSGSGIGNFSVSVPGLKEGTTYYARAYATNSKGTAYGEQISFETNNYANAANIIEGAIQAVFSVSDTKKVYFSQGNLQYQASTNTWKFAERQYDMIGWKNNNISSTYDGWIDLFGWGTSGWNSGALANQPYSVNTRDEDYCPNSLTEDYINADWGIYNKISNGGNQVNMWRTLTKEEWNYLMFKRLNAENKYGVASINGVNGLVLLPDNWISPTGVVFNNGTATIAGSEYYKTANNFTITEWMNMESNGAVFLPAAHSRKGETYASVLSDGNYWSSSSYNDYRLDAFLLWFYSDEISISTSDRSRGCSVRLVQDVK